MSIGTYTELIAAIVEMFRRERDNDWDDSIRRLLEALRDWLADLEAA